MHNYIYVYYHGNSGANHERKNKITTYLLKYVSSTLGLTFTKKDQHRSNNHIFHKRVIFLILRREKQLLGQKDANKDIITIKYRYEVR
jgi:hypothetical protein